MAVISRSHFEFSGLAQTPLRTHTLRHALIACHGDSECTLVCDEGNGKDFILSNLYVIPGGTDFLTGDKITCYTTKERALYPAPGAILTGTGHAFTKVLSNIMDGIYNGNINTCYHAQTIPGTFMLVQLSGLQPVREVKVRTQPSGALGNKLKVFEARVGNVTADGDFSEYVHLDTFFGPVTAYNMDISLESKVPIWGKFVSLKALPTEKDNYIQACTLEVR